jgi:hypothetical protein
MYFDLVVYKVDDVRTLADQDPVVYGTLVSSYGEPTIFIFGMCTCRQKDREDGGAGNGAQIELVALLQVVCGPWPASYSHRCVWSGSLKKIPWPRV